MINLPWGVDRLVWTADPGGEIPPKSQIRLLEKMFTLLDVRPENQFVMTTPTVFMCQNFSISFLVDPRGAKKQFKNLAHPWYNYDMQSMGDLY